MNTLLEVLNKGAEYLTSRGVEDARRVMELLLTHILHCDRLTLYLKHDEILTEDQLTPLRALMKRKSDGEPLQHILGYTEFMGRSFRSDKRALIPRPETEELVEIVLKRLPKDRPLRILDMGTGSGVIGITLALELGGNADITLVDISEDALSLALENALSLKVKVNSLKGDLFSAFAEQDDMPSFDAIVANLPYISLEEASDLSREVHNDPSTALYGGKQGDELINRFLEQAPIYLAPDAFVALEIGWDQADRVSQKMTDLGYSRIEVLSDMAGIRRFPLAFSPTY